MKRSSFDQEPLTVSIESLNDNEELTEACREALEAMAQVDREGSMRRAAAAGYTAAAAAPAVHEEARANAESVALPVPQYELEDLLLEDLVEPP